jgi:hypothetical protein
MGTMGDEAIMDYLLIFFHGSFNLLTLIGQTDTKLVILLVLLLLSGPLFH